MESRPAAKAATTRKSAESEKSDAPPVRHISPEEALEHIQALLEAKHERVRDGPTWPGAEQQAHPSSDPGEERSGSPEQSNTGNEPKPEHTLSHQRGSHGSHGNNGGNS